MLAQVRRWWGVLELEGELMDIPRLLLWRDGYMHDHVGSGVAEYKFVTNLQ